MKHRSRETIMWLVIFGVSMLVALAGLIYMSNKAGKLPLIALIQNRVVSRLAAILVVVAVAVLLSFVFDLINMIVIVMHAAAFLLIGDLAGYVIRRAAKADVKQYVIDCVALSLCVVYFVIGWILMHGMWESYYSLDTQKDIGKIRIAHIADSHMGTGFSGKEFADRLAVIEEKKPDMLVITGDFVDDSTMKQDMVDACAALSEFESRYGVFYCLGNHDYGYYSNERRGYSGDELLDELRNAGVKVLLDESVLIDDSFYVIGRRDAGFGGGGRMSAEEIAEGLDTDKYTIVLDHQPTDYDNEAAAGFDLVLSGHTHGGQLWPLEYIQPLMSENDNVRGFVRCGNTDFIVTDGISDWAIVFRTGCRSEYNIIDIERK